MRACLILSVIIFLSIFVPISVEAGLGVSPAVIVNERLVPGSTATAALTISRSDSSATTMVHVDTNFSAGNWITSAKGKDIEWPNGERQLLIPLSIVVPSNASFGTYNGDISVTEINTQRDERFSTQTVLGAAVQIQLTVSNTTVTDFTVPAIAIPKATAPFFWSKWKIPGTLSVILTVQNIGNTPTRPTKVQLDLYDQTEKKVLQRIETVTIPDVSAFSTKEIALSVPHNMAVGEYVAYVKVFEGYRLTEGRERRLAFSVRSESGAHHFLDLVKVIANKNLVFLIIAVTAALAVVIWRKKRNNKIKALLITGVGIFILGSVVPQTVRADVVQVSVTIIDPNNSLSLPDTSGTGSSRTATNNVRAGASPGVNSSFVQAAAAVVPAAVEDGRSTPSAEPVNAPVPVAPTKTATGSSHWPSAQKQGSPTKPNIPVSATESQPIEPPPLESAPSTPTPSPSLPSAQQPSSPTPTSPPTSPVSESEPTDVTNPIAPNTPSDTIKKSPAPVTVKKTFKVAAKNLVKKVQKGTTTVAVNLKKTVTKVAQSIRQAAVWLITTMAYTLKRS